MKFISLVIFLYLLSFGAMPKFLMPDEAFIPHAKLNDKMQIEADIELAKGMYLYEDKVRFELKNSGGFAIADIKKPNAIEHDEDKVYLQSPSFVISLKSDTQKIEDMELVIYYQGCSEDGLCYEPLQKSFSFSVDASKIVSLQSVTPKAQEASETDSISNTISSGNILVIMLTFLGFGILLSLTPCVFPMIPIISGLIVSQGEGLTTKRAFLLSLIYVLAMATAYTIAGVLAGLFGSNLQATLQNPYVIYSFSAVFVALAMSMFGFFELKLPDALVSKVSSSSNSGKHGIIGVAIMGFLSALIVGPCVAAPLAGALVYIGKTGDAILGGMALFSMGIGMGLPLIIVGVSAGKFMPRPGEWMTMVTAIFGILMLGVAIWMLEKIVDPEIITLLYALLGIGTSVYFGMFDQGVHIFKKTIAVILFIYSSALFIGVLAGGHSMTKPLEFLKAQTIVSKEIQKMKHLEFKVIKSVSELDQVLAQNKGKKILLDFSAKWCSACKELEEITFADADVKTKMLDFILVRADVTDNTAEEKELTKKFGLFGPPALLFFDENSELINTKTVIGYIEPEPFLIHLNSL